jgi:hypothetical protein
MASNIATIKLEPNTFGGNQSHAEVLDVIEPRTALYPLKRNQLIHSPTADQIALAVSGKTHRDGVFADLTLAPNFDLLEIISSPHHLTRDIRWNAIDGLKEGLSRVK